MGQFLQYFGGENGGPGDLNGDGVVGILDFSQFQTRLRKMRQCERNALRAVLSAAHPAHSRLILNSCLLEFRSLTEQVKMKCRSREGFGAFVFQSE